MKKDNKHKVGTRDFRFYEINHFKRIVMKI